MHDDNGHIDTLDYPAAFTGPGDIAADAAAAGFSVGQSGAIRRDTTAAAAGRLPAVPALAPDISMGRLTVEQRRLMRRHFLAVPAAAFFAACLVFFGRELRFAPVHRDYHGMADLLAISKARGLASQFSHAVQRVELELWQGTPAEAEARAIPSWERYAGGKRRGRRGGGATTQRHRYAAHWWEFSEATNTEAGGQKYGEDLDTMPHPKVSRKVKPKRKIPKKRRS